MSSTSRKQSKLLKSNDRYIIIKLVLRINKTKQKKCSLCRHFKRFCEWGNVFESLVFGEDPFCHCVQSVLDTINTIIRITIHVSIFYMNRKIYLQKYTHNNNKYNSGDDDDS